MGITPVIRTHSTVTMTTHLWKKSFVWIKCSTYLPWRKKNYLFCHKVGILPQKTMYNTVTMITHMQQVFCVEKRAALTIRREAKLSPATVYHPVGGRLWCQWKDESYIAHCYDARLCCKAVLQAGCDARGLEVLMQKNPVICCCLDVSPSCIGDACNLLVVPKAGQQLLNAAPTLLLFSKWGCWLHLCCIGCWC